MADYAAALRAEILREVPPLRTRWGDAATLYIGGGTPTALPPAFLTDILENLRKTAGNPIECTVEANPGTVDEAYLMQIKAAGANRLSLGVQSFDDRLLRAIGRIHTAEEARAAFHAARAAGFTNVSLDLMYGLPTQTLGDLKRSVEEALALAPEHISVYGLIVEEGTPMAAAEAAGKLALPSEDAAEEMYDWLTEALPACGYHRYEISNFARPGFESRHNLGYWRNVPYLGGGMRRIRAPISAASGRDVPSAPLRMLCVPARMPWRSMPSSLCARRRALMRSTLRVPSMRRWKISMEQ